MRMLQRAYEAIQPIVMAAVVVVLVLAVTGPYLTNTDLLQTVTVIFASSTLLQTILWTMLLIARSGSNERGGGTQKVVIKQNIKSS